MLLAQKTKAANGAITWSLISCAAIIATLVGFNNASENGGGYLIFWGAVVFGGYRAIKLIMLHSKLSGVISDLQRR